MTPLQSSLPFPPQCICGNHSCTVPYGYCHCECGVKTTISTKTDRPSGRICGIPMKFISGHQGRIRPTIEEAMPFKIEGVYCRLIPLTKGFYAIVWESDYKYLMQWHWSAIGHTNKYYAARRPSKGEKSILMHRQLLGLEDGDERQGDHKNPANTLDNRRSNLRIADITQNNCNHRRRTDNRSGYKGVHFYPPLNKWQAQICIRGKRIHLGYFFTKEEAYAAYCKAAKELHGEFANFG